jgi:hypothetical protein
MRKRGTDLTDRLNALLKRRDEVLLEFTTARPEDAERVGRNGLIELRVMLSAIADDFGLHGMSLHFVAPRHVFVPHPADGHGRGWKAEGDPLSSASAEQGKPALGGYIPGIGLWPDLQRAHLVGDHIGGLGNLSNHVTPLLGPVNRAMFPTVEKPVADFIYKGDPSQSLHYMAKAEFLDMADFQTWLVTELASLAVPPTAASDLYGILGGATPTERQIAKAVGLPAGTLLSTAQKDRVLHGLAYYFLPQKVVVTVSDLVIAPPNAILLPTGGTVTHGIPKP